MRIIGYFLLAMSLFVAACGDDDVVFTPDEAIYFVSPDTTSITRTVNDVIEVDAYFSLDSVIDSVFVGYQIDTSNQPPMNLSLSDLDEITDRIGFSSPRNQHQLQFSLPIPSGGSTSPVVPGDIVRFVFAVQSGNLIVTKTLRVDITL
ncbi:MAG: hypothetical protein DBW80_00135 [Bacteroidetes bacterium]|nr:MAG: hypothetical protein DBW80_00135 [Bacteroidota bacterium]